MTTATVAEIPDSILALGRRYAARIDQLRSGGLDMRAGYRRVADAREMSRALSDAIGRWVDSLDASRLLDLAAEAVDVVDPDLIEGIGSGDVRGLALAYVRAISEGRG